MNTKIYKQCVDILEEGGFYENAKKQFITTKLKNGTRHPVEILDQKAYDKCCITQTELFCQQVFEFLNPSKGDDNLHHNKVD